MQLLENDALNIADRRRLLTLLRILPEVERSGVLAEHIARRAARGLGNEMSPRSRGLVERMGEVASTIWREATDVIIDGKLEQAGAIEEIDDELDDLHVSLTAELTSGSMTLPVAVELALLARFYERFGDHCVNLARRPGGTKRCRLAECEKRFGDLHRVERGALAQIVVADEEREAVRHRLRSTNSSRRNSDPCQRRSAAWANSHTSTPIACSSNFVASSGESERSKLAVMERE